MNGWHFDLLGLAGCVSVVYGTYQLSEPAAYIVAGALAVALALLAAKTLPRDKK